MNIPRLALALAGMAMQGRADAHGAALSWDVTPSEALPVLLPLLVASALYAVGLARRSRRSGVTPSRARQAASFSLAVVLLSAALVWPLDAWATVSFASHMAQHMVLLVLVPPLLLAGRPGAFWLCALPAPARRTLAARVQALGANVVRHLTQSIGAAAVLHGIVLWGWHVPAAFELALRHEVVHWLEHLSLLAAGTLYWHALLRARGARLGWGVASMLATVIHSGMLGALITLAPSPLYGVYVQRGVNDPLADQQLAGLIMWVPMGTFYLVSALLFTARGLAPRSAHRAT